MRVRTRANSAFTLIELLVVISIIAILAGLTFPVLSRAREQANQTRCRSNLRQVALALLQYRTDFGDYPPPAISFVNQTTTQLEYWGGIASLMKAGYLDSPDTVRCPDDLQGLRIPKDRNTPQEETRFYSSYHNYYNYWGYQTLKVHNAQGLVIDKQFPSWVPQEIIDGTFPGDPSTAPGLFGDPSVLTTNDARAYYLRPSSVTCGSLTNAEPEVDAADFAMWDCASNDVSAVSPMLRNPHPPTNTIVAHCPHHRVHFKNAPRDLIVRADGQVQISPPILEYDWVSQPFF